MRDVDDYCLNSDYTSTVETSCPNEYAVYATMSTRRKLKTYKNTAMNRKK